MSEITPVILLSGIPQITLEDCSLMFDELLYRCVKVADVDALCSDYINEPEHQVKADYLAAIGKVIRDRKQEPRPGTWLIEVVGENEVVDTNQMKLDLEQAATTVTDQMKIDLEEAVTTASNQIRQAFEGLKSSPWMDRY